MTKTDNDLRLQRIGQIAINAKDVARATRFYRDVLGMPFLYEAPGMAFFDCEGVRLMISAPSSDEFDHPASIIYYHVDDIVHSHRQLADRGVEFVAEPHVVHRQAGVEIWMAFFRDSENNTLAMLAEINAAE